MATFRYIVGEKDAGLEIKRVIRARMGVGYRQFSMVKAAGGMLLDGVPVHANERVKQGQAVEITLVEKPSYSPPSYAGAVDIVYEDDSLMIIDKSAPLACQSSPDKPPDALENRLRARLGNPDDFVFRPVNRLDKGTSGLMVAARNAHAQMILSKSLHTGDFVREYLAIVVGAPSPASGIIDLPIRKADGATIRREVSGLGKCAVTHYEVIGETGGLSLMRLRLETGRTHQIRVHMSHIGCPVLGDFLYGTEDARLPGRFALHSARLEVTSPATGERIALDSPLPSELKAIIDPNLS